MFVITGMNLADAANIAHGCYYISGQAREQTRCFHLGKDYNIDTTIGKPTVPYTKERCKMQLLLYVHKNMYNVLVINTAQAGVH